MIILFDHELTRWINFALSKWINFALSFTVTEIEPGFSLIAKLHFAASMKVHPLASEFTELTLLKENILKHSTGIEDGCVRVPDGPGFGVDLNEDVFQKLIIRKG